MKNEKPDPKRPQLWFQPGGGNYYNRERARIIYPTGRAEFCADFNFWPSCFALRASKKRNVLLTMFAYDNKMGFGPAEFVANL